MRNRCCQCLVTAVMPSGPVYQGVLKRLAAVTVAIGTTNAGAAETLSTIPLHMAEMLVAADELDGLAEKDRIRLLDLLSNDVRPELRVRIAERLATHSAPMLEQETEALLERLALDRDPRVRDAVSSSLQILLPRLSGLERTSLVGRWATSPHFEQRLIIAQALQKRFPVLWIDVIVEHLACDPVASVRAAAWSVARARGLQDTQDTQDTTA